MIGKKGAQAVEGMISRAVTVAPIRGAGRLFRGDRARITLLALPFVLFVLLFSYAPLFGWAYAFFDFRPGVKLAQSAFVGLEYFRRALDFRSGSELLKVIRNTLGLSALSIALTPLAPLFAMLLNEMRGRPFRRVIQTLTTLPYFISWILVFAIAFATFSINDGFLNAILLRLGILKDPINPLANGPFAWYFQTLIGVWKNLGYTAIIYLAAIAGIDQELYDAASVDGAGRFRRALHVTVPGMVPTYLVLLLLDVCRVLANGFDQYYAFMNALVQDRIMVLDYYIYRVGLALNEYSYATAIGIFRSVVSIGLLFGVNWIAKRIRGYAIV